MLNSFILNAVLRWFVANSTHETQLGCNELFERPVADRASGGCGHA